MALYDNDDIDLGSTPKVYFLSSNLDSPILIHEIEATSILFEAACDSKHSARATIPREFLSSALSLAKHNGWTKEILSCLPKMQPNLYPRAEHLALQSQQPNTSLFYSQAAELISPLVEAAEAGLQRRGIFQDDLHRTLEALKGADTTVWSQAYEAFQNAYGRASYRTRKSPSQWTKAVVGKLEFWINTRYALLKIDGHLFASSPNQILMIKDKLSVRYMLLTHCLPLGYSANLRLALSSLFKWQDKTLETYSNGAYNLLKAVEPLFKTRLSFLNDNVFGDDSAYPRMIKKMEEKERALSGGKVTQIHALGELVCSVTDTQELVELFGSQKSCGHPTVDARGGGLSAAEEAMTPDLTHLTDAQNLRNTFCHIFTTAYTKKHGRWPRLKFLQKGLGLEQLYIAQRRSLWYHDYSLDDWTHVEFKQIFDFDYFDNYLDLLDDKSISFYRDELHMSWDQTVRPSSQRRLLLEILRRDTLDLRSIVKTVSSREVPYRWKVVSLYPKEREFKPDNPRMFAMMVIEMRCFFTCTEANIADNVFEYMPQQTMTKSKRQIQQRFLEFTDTSRSRDTWSLFIEVDLTRWNLRWREMTVNLIGRDMNRMFNMPGTFDVCHWFFEQSQIIVRVANLPPNGVKDTPIPRSELAWTGHKGGFEGICQKLWTSCTYAMVEIALRELLQQRVISRYELIGQADNQVLKIEVPMSSEPRQVALTRARDLANQKLEEVCASVGQEVKAEENVESTSVLTYSKDVYVAGVERPTSLKKHSRLFPVTSLDFPSIGSNSGAIMAGAVAGAENSLCPLSSAVIGWYHTARYLLAASAGFTIHGVKAPRMTHDEILAALIIPPSIGGLVGTPLASFMYKGGSDPLGKEVSSLRILAESLNRAGSIASRSLRALEQRYHFSAKPDLHQLIDNPYGLPLDKKISPLGSVSSRTLTAFRSKVINRDIEPLLKASVESASKSLKDDLLTIRPVNPLLLHDLYKASIFGTVDEVRRMFLATRTVQSVAQWTDSRITHIFLDADIRSVSDFLKWYKGLPALRYSGRLSFQIVEDARAGWSLPITGVSTYQPLDWKFNDGHTHHPTALRWSVNPLSDTLNTRGPLSGYLGSDTREKRSEHGYKIHETGIPARAMNKLQLIRSQAYGSTEFNILLDKIGLTRTDTLLSDITESLPKIIGGSWAHHYSSSLREMGASYMGPLTLATHVRLDTDSVAGISGDTRDFPWMAQQDMVMMMMAAYYAIRRSVTLGEVVLDTQRMVPLVEDPMKCSPSAFRPGLTPKTKLSFTSLLSLASTYDSVNMRVPRGILQRVENYGSLATIKDAFEGFFSSILRDQQTAKTLADSRGSTSVQTSLQIDIAEAHALGLFTLAECIASSIINTCSRDTYRTSITSPERWDDGTFLLFQIRALVVSVRQYLYHPLCRCDSRHCSLLFGSLKYSGNFSPIRSMEALVRKKIAAVYTDLDHTHWTSPVPMFPGGSAMTLSEALTTSICKYLLRIRLSGALESEILDRLYASMVVLDPTALESPDYHLRVLQDKTAAYAHRVGREVGPSYRVDLERLSLLGGVLVYNDDTRTIMRYARLLPKPGAERRVLNPLCKKVNVEGAQVTSLKTVKPVTRLDRLWNQSELSPKGGISTLSGAWMPLLTNLKVERQVLVVGVGHGMLADLVLRTFPVTVLGLDLTRDMPDTQASLVNYVPLAVSAHLRHKYLQLDESLSTSGDWVDQTIQQRILGKLTQPTNVLIDITPPELPDILTLVELSLKCEQVVEICCRYYGSADWLESQMATVSGYKSVKYLVGADYSGISLILRFPKQVKMRTRENSLPVTLYKHAPLSQIPGRYSQLLSMASFNLWAWQQETILEARQILLTMARTTLNKPKELQLTYKYRVDLIMALMTFTAAVSETPKGLVQDWISCEAAFSCGFYISLTPSRCEILVRNVPRLHWWSKQQLTNDWRKEAQE